MTPELQAKIRKLVGAPETVKTWVSVDVESVEDYSCCSGNITTTYVLTAGLTGADYKAAQKAGESWYWSRTFSDIEYLLQEMLRNDV